MALVDVSAVTQPLNLNPETEVEEIIQNVRTILNTMVYTVPYDRRFALFGDYLDNPLPQNKPLAAADIVQAIREREPRAEINEIFFDGDEITGKLIPIVRIYINE